MSRLLAGLLLAGTAFTFPLAASAATTAVFCGPSAGQACEGADEQMVWLQAKTNTTQGFGNVGGQFAVPIMNIDSLGGQFDTLIDLKNGFATIKPSNLNSFNGLDFTIPGYLFTDLVFDVQLYSPGQTFVTSGFSGNHVLVPFANTFTNQPNQDAEYSITAIGGFFNEVSIDATASNGFKEVKHIEVSGLCKILAGGGCEPVPDPDPVPEPASLALLGVGLLGLGFVTAKRRN